MNNTFDKLLEAKYFLERMIEFQADRMPFKYNLSAFLAAFRSVTLFMQREYSDAENFNLWYSIKQKELESNEKMQLLNRKRVMTIHKVSVELHAHINVSIHERVFAADESSAEIVHADGTIEKDEQIIADRWESPSETIIDGNQTIIDDKWLWYFDDYPHSDIVSLCDECTIYLANIVSECSSTFSLH
jgi:hypothetical protein